MPLEKTPAAAATAAGLQPQQAQIFPLIVSYEGLSQLLHRSVGTLQTDACRRPGSLPPACTLPGSRTPLWVVEDVIAWVRAHRDNPDTSRLSPVKRRAGPGASTKAERLAAQAAGLSVKEWRAIQVKGGEK